MLERGETRWLGHGEGKKCLQGVVRLGLGSLQRVMQLGRRQRLQCVVLRRNRHLVHHWSTPPRGRGLAQLTKIWWMTHKEVFGVEWWSR